MKTNLDSFIEILKSSKDEKEMEKSCEEIDKILVKEIHLYTKEEMEELTQKIEGAVRLNPHFIITNFKN
jgi:hypothetical protein